MTKAAPVVQYIREKAVFDFFKATNNRLKSLGANNPPPNLHFVSDSTPNTCEAVYDEFRARFTERHGAQDVSMAF